MSNHEWTLTDTNQSRENRGLYGYHGLGSAHGSRAYFGGLAETVFYFTTKNIKLKEIFESGKQDEEMRHELSAFVLERNAPIT